MLFLRVIFIFLLTFFVIPVMGQGGRYWDQNLNSEAALLSGAVVAGEGGIAAIYYNPATISQMKRDNLSLSANLFSVYYFNARNALGSDLPADRTQLNIYPRIITLTLKPKKKPDLTIELAYFVKTNEYLQINRGTSHTGDIVTSNPGDENYTGEYYLRSKFQDYNGGAGFGYKLSNDFSVGLTALVSYKDDQYYNMINASAFTGPGNDIPVQYLSDSRFHQKYNMYDVRLVTKLGFHLKKESWAIGADISFPSLKLFGGGTVVKQYEYSNIHTEAGNPVGFDLYYAGRQTNCTAHFKDPLSIAAGVNYYSPSGNSILLFTAEYFFGISDFAYIEAKHDPGEDGYNYSPQDPEQWLSFTSHQNPVFNAGIAFKQQINSRLWLSSGFRTDFNYLDKNVEQGFPENNIKTGYPLNVYHLNYGVGSSFKRGSLILGMQFSYGQVKDRRQLVNITDPVEYINDAQMPLTGQLYNNVRVRYTDITVYLGFSFNFMKEEK
jgi:hypothetical protein